MNDSCHRPGPCYVQGNAFVPFLPQSVLLCSCCLQYHSKVVDVSIRTNNGKVQHVNRTSSLPLCTPQRYPSWDQPKVGCRTLQHSWHMLTFMSYLHQPNSNWNYNLCSNCWIHPRALQSGLRIWLQLSWKALPISRRRRILVWRFML